MQEDLDPAVASAPLTPLPCVARVLLAVLRPVLPRRAAMPPPLRAGERLAQQKDQKDRKATEEAAAAVAAAAERPTPEDRAHMVRPSVRPLPFKLYIELLPCELKGQHRTSIGGFICFSHSVGSRNHWSVSADLC